GMQLLAHQLGGRVELHSGRREYGPAEIWLDPGSESAPESARKSAQADLAAARQSGATSVAGWARHPAPAPPFARFQTPASRGIPVWMSHGDSVGGLPPGFVPLARSESGALAAMANTRGLIGIQFHPEVRHTPQGTTIIENFLFGVCYCTPTWTPGAFIEE